jgi:prevent-host-death family protein
MYNFFIKMYNMDSLIGGGLTMDVSATELKMNLSKYLSLAKKEEIMITKNGKVIARLVPPNTDKMALLNSLVGVIPDTMSLEESIAERRSKI